MLTDHFWNQKLSNETNLYLGMVLHIIIAFHGEATKKPTLIKMITTVRGHITSKTGKKDKVTDRSLIFDRSILDFKT